MDQISRIEGDLVPRGVLIAARPHPFDTKKVEVDFSKKSIFMDFRGKKK